MKVRTFVAVEVSESIRQKLARFTRTLDAPGAAVRWVAPHNMHLTLKFLGDISAKSTHEICRTVADAASGIAPIQIEVAGIGAFPNVRRPRTIWAGVEQGAEQLIELQGRIDQSLADIGYTREGRRFRPHITIGRHRGHSQGLALSDFLMEHETESFGTCQLSQAAVFSSELQSSGPKYSLLGTAPFAAG